MNPNADRKDQTDDLTGCSVEPRPGKRPPGRSGFRKNLPSVVSSRSAHGLMATFYLGNVLAKCISLAGFSTHIKIGQLNKPGAYVGSALSESGQMPTSTAGTMLEA